MAAYSVKKKQEGPTFEGILRDVKAGNVKPVYYLMGEEGYYIDRLADSLTDLLLTPEEKEFNLISLYGADADIDQIMTQARAYPMGGARQVIVVKEAGNLKRMERFELYFRQVQPTTVIIFCHKNGKLDRRLKVASLISSQGVLFESPRLKDMQLIAFVRDYLRSRQVNLAPGAAEMMAEFVGADLSRMATELDKLILALPQGENMVTADLVRGHIGQTKNYTIFELLDAIGTKDVLKANKIAKYFDSNPKENALPMVLASLFKYFAQLMVAYYSPDKSEAGIAQWVGLTNWQVRYNILPPMRYYTGVKVMYILSEIRRTDARSKGVDNPATSDGDLLKELLYYILH